MTTYLNPLVIKMIDSLDDDETTKEVLKELIELEATYGSEKRNAKLKESECRKIVTKGMKE